MQQLQALCVSLVGTEQASSIRSVHWWSCDVSASTHCLGHLGWVTLMLKRTVRLLESRQVPSDCLCLTSTAGTSCREEVLAYTEAVHRLRDGHVFLEARRPRGLLPAPELDMVPPNRRVEHYMSKLRNFLLVDRETKERYDAAARKIQNQYRHYHWRKTLKAIKCRVLALPFSPWLCCVQ